MKKVVVLFVVILTCLFTSACYSEEDVTAAKNKGYEAGYRDGYKVGYEEGYEEGYAAPDPMPRPASGRILSGREYDESEITITADSSSDYVVSLKDYWGSEYLAFYVRAGTTVTVGVPACTLRVYFASGTEWYGYGKNLMFGKNTVYSKDDELLDFSEYTWQYTLYPVDNGNFSETPSSEDEFF